MCDREKYVSAREREHTSNYFFVVFVFDAGICRYETGYRAIP